MLNKKEICRVKWQEGAGNVADVLTKRGAAKHLIQRTMEFGMIQTNQKFYPKDAFAQTKDPQTYNNSSARGCTLALKRSFKEGTPKWVYEKKIKGPS